MVTFVGVTIEVVSGALKIRFPDLKNPVQLDAVQHDGGVMLKIPWVYRDRLGADSGYATLKALLRPHFGELRIETRTETDPKFRASAQARVSKNVTSNRIKDAIHA